MDRLIYILLIYPMLVLGCTEKSTIPQVHIKTEHNLDFDKKKAIQMEYISGTDSFSLGGTAKWRGGWSRQFDKRSYTLDTEYPIQLGGMTAHTKWVLNASYIDKTLMRHRFWYELWTSMSDAHIAAGCRYVTLSVDEVDQGLYVAMERIHESRLHLEEDGVLFKDPPVFRNDTIQFEKEDTYFHQKFPDPGVENRDNLLFAFREFLLTSDSIAFNNQIDSWVDLNNIIDWHLLLLLSHNGDGLLKNFYLFKRSKSDLLKVIPWDYDHSAGRDGDNELNLRNTFMDDERNILLKRLMKSNASAYNDRRCARWWQLRKSGLFSKTHIRQNISDLKTIINPEVENNFNIWPINGTGYYDNNSHSEEVKLMEKYLMNRIAFLDKYFDCQKLN